MPPMPYLRLSFSPARRCLARCSRHTCRYVIYFRWRPLPCFAFFYTLRCHDTPLILMPPLLLIAAACCFSFSRYCRRCLYAAATRRLLRRRFDTLLLRHMLMLPPPSPPRYAATRYADAAAADALLDIVDAAPPLMPCRHARCRAIAACMPMLPVSRRYADAYYFIMPLRPRRLPSCR